MAKIVTTTIQCDRCKQMVASNKLLVDLDIIQTFDTLIDWFNEVTGFISLAPLGNIEDLCQGCVNDLYLMFNAYLSYEGKVK